MSAPTPRALSKRLPPLRIDGSLLEGGGQVLRNGFALSALTGRGLTVHSIRASRPRGGGLAAQHLGGIELCARVDTGSKLDGALLKSTVVTFTPSVVSNNSNSIGGDDDSVAVAAAAVAQAKTATSTPEDETNDSETKNITTVQQQEQLAQLQWRWAKALDDSTQAPLPPNTLALHNVLSASTSTTNSSTQSAAQSKAQSTESQWSSATPPVGFPVCLINTAGAAALVLQLILPVLMYLPVPTVLTVTGGTHVPFSPPVDYIRQVLLPVLNKLLTGFSTNNINNSNKDSRVQSAKSAPMRELVQLSVLRRGFMPNGGGICQLSVVPTPLWPANPARSHSALTGTADTAADDGHVSATHCQSPALPAFDLTTVGLPTTLELIVTLPTNILTAYNKSTSSKASNDASQRYGENGAVAVVADAFSSAWAEAAAARVKAYEQSKTGQSQKAKYSEGPFADVDAAGVSKLQYLKALTALKPVIVLDAVATVEAAEAESHAAKSGYKGKPPVASDVKPGHGFLLATVGTDTGCRLAVSELFQQSGGGGGGSSSKGHGGGNSHNNRNKGPADKNASSNNNQNTNNNNNRKNNNAKDSQAEIAKPNTKSAHTATATSAAAKANTAAMTPVPTAPAPDSNPALAGYITIARAAARQLSALLSLRVCADWHLQDQLIVFAALAEGRSRVLVGDGKRYSRSRGGREAIAKDKAAATAALAQCVSDGKQCVDGNSKSTSSNDSTDKETDVAAGNKDAAEGGDASTEVLQSAMCAYLRHFSCGEPGEHRSVFDKSHDDASSKGPAKGVLSAGKGPLELHTVTAMLWASVLLGVDWDIEEEEEEDDDDREQGQGGDKVWYTGRAVVTVKGAGHRSRWVM